MTKVQSNIYYSIPYRFSKFFGGMKNLYKNKRLISNMTTIERQGARTLGQPCLTTSGLAKDGGTRTAYDNGVSMRENSSYGEAP